MQPYHFVRVSIVFVWLVIDLSQGQLYLGDACRLQNGAPGQCKITSACRSVFDSLHDTDTQTVICGYIQSTPIVCCPTNDPPRKVHPRVTSTTSSPWSSAEGGISAESDACRLQNGAPGQCKSLSECRSVLDSLHNTKPVICRFNQSTPIVCCPADNPPRRVQPTVASTTPSPTSSAVGAKSAEMCNFYSQFVYQVVQSPTTLLNPEFFNESVCASREHTPNQAPLRDPEEALYREFPHVASLGYGPESSIQWLCAGSLISERFILTTAHCINSPNNGKVKWVRVGDLTPKETENENNSEVIHKVVKWIKHENYRESSPWLNDIALLGLENEISFIRGTARPACLYTEPGNPLGHRYASAVGWGMTSWDDTTTTFKMMKKDLTFVRARECASSSQRPTKRRHPSSQTTNSTICVTDSSPERAPCVGDSGGPLQIEIDSHYCMLAIVGLTSFDSRACVTPTTPASYTRVSDYIGWIESHVWPESA